MKWCGSAVIGACVIAACTAGPQAGGPVPAPTGSPAGAGVGTASSLPVNPPPVSPGAGQSLPSNDTAAASRGTWARLKSDNAPGPNMVEYDTATVRRTGDTVTVSVRRDARLASQSDPWVSQDVRVDCAGRRWWTLRGTSANSGWKLTPTDRRGVSIAAGSLGEALAMQVCGKP